MSKEIYLARRYHNDSEYPRTSVSVARDRQETRAMFHISGATSNLYWQDYLTRKELAHLVSILNDVLSDWPEEL